MTRYGVWGEAQELGLCIGLDKAAGPEALTAALGSLEKPWAGLGLSPCSLPVPRGLSSWRRGWQAKFPSDSCKELPWFLPDGQ